MIFIGLAIGPLLAVGAILAWRSFTSLQQQSLLLQQEAAKRVNIQVAAFFQELEEEMRFTIQTQDLERLNQDHTGALSDLLAYQPAFDELHLLDSQGRELVSAYRLGFATSTTVDRSQAEEFTIPKTTGQVYYGSIFYDETTSEPLITIALPVTNLRTGSVDGVLVSVARIKKVWDLIAGIDVSQGQSIYIVDAQGKVVAHRNPSIVLRDTSFNVPKQNGIQLGLNGERAVLAFDSMSLGQQQLTIIAEQTLTEALAPAINIVFITLVLVMVVAGVASGLSLLNVRRIVQPIQALVKTAEEISAGDLTLQAQISSNDEIGMLATAFNSMTSQLRDLIGSLEQRVADRTKALAASSEVSRRLSTILNRKELVIEVVEQVKEAFGYYHAHIYLLEGDELVMAGGTGDAGAAMLADGHRLPKGRGLVGRAAESNEPVLVPDTTQDPDWLPNSLLPDTKSEVAIPISVGDQVLGVLDVQQDRTNGLGQEDVDALQSIANQVAVAMQNINQYENTQKIAADLGVVANVGIATSTITEVSHLLQEVVDLSKRSFNLYHAHIYLLNETGDTLELASGAGEVGRKMVAEGRQIPLNSEQSLVARAARTQEGVVVNDVQADPDFLPNPLLPKTRAEMAVPMLVSGKVIGVLDVQSEQMNHFTDTDVDIQTTLASQIAVALQNAHSFTNAQKQVERETKLNLIAQKIQSTTTIEEAMQIAARELGNALGKRQTLVTLDPVVLAGESKGVTTK
jgi:GAF domain-containing protein/HAMP domain-containing protein